MIPLFQHSNIPVPFDVYHGSDFIIDWRLSVSQKLQKICTILPIIKKKDTIEINIVL